MRKLSEAKTHKVYQVKEIQTTAEIQLHLNHLGLIPGSKVVLLQTVGENGIVLLHNSRLALDQQILEKIMIEEAKETGEWVSLDQLAIGDTATVVGVHGEGAVKRRLMDMGLTKNVRVQVRKRAPLGDPIEITVRGSELTLRKNEAAYILVEKEQ
ncbi:FeoA family protein [Enterococcus sp. JM9B]|uniref:FeoA family protein n=1 Tax=Enterococcus sp. JM9B TaxID=1857216 RepID=UPI001374C0F1|nr:ferrous iron transport protein A [Enterococcus sp. JM9B]KAF1300750.1 ferrous iron transporter A [Enterococcus sp. JM9B]